MCVLQLKRSFQKISSEKKTIGIKQRLIEFKMLVPGIYAVLDM